MNRKITSQEELDEILEEEYKETMKEANKQEELPNERSN